MKKKWWIKPYIGHVGWTRFLCFIGIHLNGQSGLSCTYDRTKCDHCGEDVLFVLHDHQKERSDQMKRKD